MEDEAVEDFDEDDMLRGWLVRLKLCLKEFISKLLLKTSKLGQCGQNVKALYFSLIL